GADADVHGEQRPRRLPPRPRGPAGHPATLVRRGPPLLSRCAGRPRGTVGTARCAAGGRPAVADRRAALRAPGAHPDVRPAAHRPGLSLSVVPEPGADPAGEAGAGPGVV